MGATAIQMGTLVKLVRVLMLGPVCVILSILAPRLCEDSGEPTARVSAERPKSNRPPLHHLVPWFILGFLGMVAARPFGLIPHAVLAPRD
ncbi:putative sulfate exporter family transporter [Sphingopyxis sp.]|uniref:putative sulfate exporter family transporter n=1 Tax=Sphingopyxis sp. TaxID=1908224 RepID=UPI002604A4B5|nr:putative sulfate exporter family transporter [Sphingopyxis sp.]MCW0200076.1 putative sulfate exporter family transporter [Sphingopyxis sp.]